jgi:hypothetical protein
MCLGLLEQREVKAGAAAGVEATAAAAAAAIPVL